MTRERTAARRSTGKLAIAVFLLGSLLVGLSACRGFFGQGPIALMVINSRGDTELPVVVEFDISGSIDPDGVIASFTLDFGDGTTAPPPCVDVSPHIWHTYVTAGTYTAELTVMDTDGRIGMTNGIVVIGPAMITFAANRGSSFDIYRMVADGTNQVAVLHTADAELFPDLVRGTRDRIAYAAEETVAMVAYWSIWTMTVNGTNRTPLTTQTPPNQIQPSWSHDASTLAYASNDAQTPSLTTWEIWTMTAAGTVPDQLTTQSPSWAIAPSCSPVSDDILFVSGSKTSAGLAADGGSAIWLWDASAGVPVLLKDGPGRDGDASPALATLLGPTLTANLKLPANAGISRPVWSPDGTKIAYAAEVAAGGQIDIFVMSADGIGVPQTLAQYVAVVGVPNPAITTSAHEFCPYWLEDGSGIVYAKEDGLGNFQLYKVTFATGVITDLTEIGDNISPASKHRTP
jgi:Tol biopolymer transport system component